VEKARGALACFQIVADVAARHEIIGVIGRRVAQDDRVARGDHELRGVVVHDGVAHENRLVTTYRRRLAPHDELLGRGVEEDLVALILHRAIPGPIEQLAHGRVLLGPLHQLPIAAE
jgi:hypothetical protein